MRWHGKRMQETFMDYWVLIAVVSILVISVLIGGIRGFLRFTLPLISLVIAIVCARFVVDPVYYFLKDTTPVYSHIKTVTQEKIVEGVEGEIRNIVKEKITQMGEGQQGTLAMVINGLAGLLGGEESNAPDAQGIIDDQVDQLIGNLNAESMSNLSGYLDQDQQTQILEATSLPQTLKTMLIRNNNATKYRELGVDNFFDYIGAFFAHLITRGLAIILTILIVGILIRAVTIALGIATKMPVIHGINSVAGAFVGLIFGLGIVWILFLALTMGAATDLGRAGLNQIEENQFLRILYNLSFFLPWIS